MPGKSRSAAIPRRAVALLETASKYSSFVVGAALAAYVIYVFQPLVDPARWDYHDFALYYRAASALVSGASPYDVTVMAGSFPLRYVYTPVTLLFFVPFTWFSFEVACIVFLATKCVALAALLVIWQRMFLNRPGVWFAAFCLFSFNSALYIDLSVGNVEILLQLLLWAGFACFVAGRHRAFAGFVLAAALFKLTPALLLVLLLFEPGPRRAVRAGAIPLVVFGVLFFLPVALEPAWWSQIFTETGRNVGFTAPINQSVLSFAKALFGAPRSGPLTTAVYLLHVLVVVAVTTLVVASHRRGRSREEHVRVVHFVALAYLLVLPRLQDYQLALAIAPCFYLVFYSRFATAPLLFVIVLVQAANIRLPGMIEFYRTFFNFKLLLIVYAAWILFAIDLAGRRVGWYGLGSEPVNEAGRSTPTLDAPRR